METIPESALTVFYRGHMFMWNAYSESYGVLTASAAADRIAGFKLTVTDGTVL